MLKHEIEEELEGKGDFVKIDLLERYLDQSPPLDLKKFALRILIQVYDNIKMFNEAGKTEEILATNSIAFSEKNNHFVKAAGFYIKASQFNSADYAMKRAMVEANQTEKQDIYFAVKDFYKRQAEVYERELKRKNALRIYEKLLEMNISDLEKKEIKERLLGLYEKLGMLKEYYALKKALD